MEATWPTAVRSKKICAFWSTFTFMTILGFVISNTYPRQEFAIDYSAVSALLAAFSAQAFLAEAIGLRANRQRVSFPRRLFAHFGFPTLWRRQIALKDISRADSLDERTIRFYLLSTELVDILFPDIRSKRQFLRYIGEELARAPKTRLVRKRGRL